ncbi:hypothetical protein CC1G_10402 [Coprinopsis cinerea okayama7|uniref:Uncharacterized protein n=1 Tax=Coprinopsis cinerea (strain Okayama-7 / 130 / ATCC MYA-4618 / FGSC 9003) TaxID=240176 RepID=A8PAN2_COPC7|nr:hypothetical protein CC1G_10402 [Coprinopsis cinerea okayama7\|eukprot:XP_001840018.2 hypothetical protein CC1G_10402 [Coprinopsis cinerea okayama7\
MSMNTDSNADSNGGVTYREICPQRRIYLRDRQFVVQKEIVSDGPDINCGREINSTRHFFYKATSEAPISVTYHKVIITGVACGVCIPFAIGLATKIF